MKARSVVFTHQQYPDSVFGLPPLMTLTACIVAVLAFVVLIILGIFVSSIFIVLALVTFAAVLAGGIYLAWRVGRTDRHVESVFLTSSRFWRGSPRRWLLAGSAPVSPRGGRK